MSINVFTMIYVAFRGGLLARRRAFRSVLAVTANQIYATGCEALPLVAALAFAIGGIVELNTTALSFIGTAEATAGLMVVVVVRELGPLLVALLLIARSGTAISTNIANMNVSQELDALASMNIDPLSYVVFPRLIAGIVCSICLTFYFDAFALAGGFAATQLLRHDIPLSLYHGLIADSMRLADIPLFFARTIINGLCVFAVACHEGLVLKGGTPDVPKATARAVLRSAGLIAITTVAATVVFYKWNLIAVPR